MKKVRTIVLFLLLVATLVIAGSRVFSRSRITCVITNATREAVTGLTVDVAGNRASLGTLEAGETRTITLSPRDHAGGVVVEFMLPDGTPKTEVIYGYVESRHFGGEAHIEIGPEGKVQLRSNSIGLRVLP
jgi:hypothetical protein